jgi:hypothetical protein
MLRLRDSRKKLVVARNDRRTPCADTCAMPPASQSVRVVLDLEVGSEPIRGTITDADSRAGETQGYVGWLALIGALEARRSAVAERLAAPPPAARKEER